MKGLTNNLFCMIKVREQAIAGKKINGHGNKIKSYDKTPLENIPDLKGG